MKSQDQHPRKREEEQTVASLLTHLQQMRRSVPVNYQLKADLKKQLLERMKELEMQKNDSPVSPPSGRRKKWINIVAAAMLLGVFIGTYVWWDKDVLAVEERNVLSMPIQTTEEQIDINPAGTQVAYVGPNAVVRTLSLDQKKHPVTISLPPTKGSYRAIAWANRSNQVAVVEQLSGQSRIWIVDLPDQNNVSSSRLLKEEDRVTYHSPTWSPNDETIAYTRVKDGTEEIWMSSTVSFQEWKMAEGSQPEWSPDGRYLAFTKEGSIHVMEIRTGKVTVMGEGKWPSWMDDLTLTYTTPKGTLVEAQLDEGRVVQVELGLPSLSGEQVVRGNWAAEGKQLLLVHHDEQPGSLVISLASR
ncbi:PD40 domain-containing protein [Brevibacillus choshinensis]|uniref:PD40 domain-containing protein n=1 Tax=Brevibacillus choshinensis TaxID=54911 RepID=A0ABX7FJ40_BRECH|nr:PD40 domain-containing protein [Brevibacillus choshinensis]QRG65346.1 PD40 domain-containing protein [Brevibacillus choshinensis]